jgi:Domain of unknown function (DUF4291)
MLLAPYSEQSARWPARGRHILAQFDVDTILVYQAYRPEIAVWAVNHQRFGGPFSFSRMSWIKPNFLWMMFRCGWATKEGQEHVLAVRLTRTLFDLILKQAVPSSFVPELYADHAAWQALRGPVLAEYARPIAIEDRSLTPRPAVASASDCAHPPAASRKRSCATSVRPVNPPSRTSSR